jgi:hypothetical protein
LSLREWAAVGPLAVMCIAMGVFPQVFLAPMEPSVEAMVKRLHREPAAVAVRTVPAPAPIVTEPIVAAPVVMVPDDSQTPGPVRMVKAGAVLPAPGASR